MWTVLYNGEEKSLEDWGIQNLVRTPLSQDVGRVTFNVPRDIDQEELFAFGETVTLRRDGVQWFVGRVDQTPRTANGRYESHGYVLVDPWWYLENLVFQQGWEMLTNPLDPDEGTTEVLHSRLILNQTTLGTIVNTTAQIRQVLEYAIESGANFQIGQIDLPAAFPPTYEVTDRTCGEVIRLQTRWTPSAVSWFDHSTTPPTLHIKQRSSLAPITVNGVPNVNGPSVQDVSIVPRHDLVLPAVVLKYNRTNIVNGRAYPQTFIDAVPFGATGRAFRTLLSTINLEGAQVSYSMAEIVAETINTASVDWWKGQYAPLADESFKNITITGVVRQTSLPRELVAGAVTSWLLSKENATVQKETIKAFATYDIADEDGTILEKRVSVPIDTEIVATDLETGTFQNSLSVELAEQVPTGLANYIYQATQALHYDGSFTITEDECSGAVGIGNVVNLQGYATAYQTMNAVVQSISESIDDGKTTVTIGPPKHLGKDDIIEFLQANRGRVRITPASVMVTGESFPSTPYSAGKETPRKNSNSDGGKLDKFTVGTHMILDKVDNPEGREMRARKTDVCVKQADGTLKNGFCMAMRSEVWFE